MKRMLLLLFLSGILLVQAVNAQETYFGKNKVRYKDFKWKYIQTRHFDIYFYENAYPTAKFAAQVLESAYVEIVEELDYMIKRRVPVFIYNSHNDFQQTNIVSEILPEGVGGFTEAFKNRIVVPFTGSYEDFRHVLHHELTHAVIYDMIFGNSLSSLISMQRLFQVPLWFSEGYAEYSSRHGWDYWSDMYVRDATINGYLAPPDYLGGFLAYKQGQAMVKFIADKYGEKKLGEILRKGKVHLTMNKAIKAALGVTQEEFWEEFQKEMKRRYWPEIALRKEADEIGKQLTHAGEDGSHFNEKPEFSPDGDKLAIFSDKHDYTEILLISSADGKELKRLVRSERSGDLESLHWYVSGMSFSPDGKSLVFVAKSKGKEALFFADIRHGQVFKKKRLDFYNILSPVYSPDGNEVAFSALSGHKRDIYIYHIDTDKIEQLTDDRYDDVSPSWLHGTSEIVFSSDRPHPQSPAVNHYGQPYANPGAVKPGDFDYGTYNIFKVETAGLRIEPIDVGPGSNTNPTVSPDGKKIAFISNRNGIDNIYVGYLDSTRYYAVTDILSGVRNISWSPEGNQLAFSAFYKGGFDIFLMKDIKPAGDNGVLAKTDFMKGKYNLIDPDQRGRLAHRHREEEQDSTSAASDSTMQTIEAVPASSDTLVRVDSLPLDTTTSVGMTGSVDSIATDSAAAAIGMRSDSSMAADTIRTAAADTAAADTTKPITETGIYDNEYVFVSNHNESAIDSLFTDVIDRDSLAESNMMDEPASFDSISPPLPDGEYKIHDYKVKFTPDYVGGGFAYDTWYGLRGQTVFVFSDYLGNHEIAIATDIVQSIDESYVFASYLNHKKRTTLGVGLFHTKNYYLDNNDYLFSDRFYGVQGIASRPSSMYTRFDFTLSQYLIDRKYYDRPWDTRPDRSTKATKGEIAWVFDNVLWGYTGPVNGTRAKLTLGSAINFFNARQLEFYSAEFDYRRYWHLARAVSFAFRVTGGLSEGRTPKQYFLGGTTNWIGNRTFEARVYDVENLYFADVVTPLRGQKYYGLSGNRYGLMNLELRFPVVQYFALKYPLPMIFSNIMGNIFVDVGSAWTDNQNRWKDVKTGFGTGLRLNLFGFALLRYDVAWSTDWNNVSDKPTHYFSLGADF